MFWTFFTWRRYTWSNTDTKYALTSRMRGHTHTRELGASRPDYWSQARINKHIIAALWFADLRSIAELDVSLTFNSSFNYKSWVIFLTEDEEGSWLLKKSNGNNCVSMLWDHDGIWCFLCLFCAYRNISRKKKLNI